MVIFLLIVLGLCFGSFVNALVWRLHEQTKPKAKQARGDLSITKGRSVCTHCGHVLQPIDLIPVVSWLAVRGKCRYCHRPIGWQYPVVELLTAGLFCLSYVAWPLELQGIAVAQFGVWLAILVLFVALAVYDLRWMVLPDRLVSVLTALAGLYVGMDALRAGSLAVFWGAFLGVVCLAGLFYVIFQVSGGKWIGGGDVKLGVSLGMLAGSPVQSILLLFLASLAGTIIVLPLLLTGKKRMSQKLPFGPFLIVATILVCLFGAALITWYKNQFLLL